MISGEVYVDLMSGVKASVALKPRADFEAVLLGRLGKVMANYKYEYLLSNSVQCSVQKIYFLNGSQTEP